MQSNWVNSPPPNAHNEIQLHPSNQLCSIPTKHIKYSNEERSNESRSTNNVTNKNTEQFNSVAMDKLVHIEF